MTEKARRDVGKADVLSSALEIKPIVDGLLWQVDVRSILEKTHLHWDTEMLNLAKTAKRAPIQGGSVSTSMASPDFVTDYNPTNRLTIARELPWVVDFFKGAFRDLVEKATGDSSVRLGQDPSALNMNLTFPGKPYELHTDRNPWTGMLIVITMNEGEGGETVFWPASLMLEGPSPSLRRPGLNPDLLNRIDHWQELSHEDRLKAWKELEIWNLLYPKEGEPTYLPVATVRPQAGTLLIFNGRDHIHEVRAFTPSSSNRFRLTVPGNYYTTAVPEVPDPDFNKQIGVGK